MKHVFLSVFIILLITGCAGVGVVKTDNPQEKLDQADYLLYQQNRPLLAEKLIFEAITDYRQTNNQFGLANALRDYGDLLGSSEVAQAGVQFLRAGFQDHEVTMHNNLDKAQYYFIQSIEHYKLAAHEANQNNQLSKLMNINYNIASLYARLGNTIEACSFFNQALQAYDNILNQNPNEQIPAPQQGGGSASDFIKNKQTSIGCKL